MSTHSQSDDFDIAKGIFDQLKDLPTERQQRVLRWISEGLGISPALPPQAGAGASAFSSALGAPVISAATTVEATDIKTFIYAKAPKSDNQFAAAVAYFYRFESPPAARRDSINGDALQEATRLAGRKRLANPNTTLNNAKKAGYLDSTSPGAFTINSVGENLVAMTLPGGAEPSGARRRPSKGRGKTRPAKK